jgi:hypothetical protein
MGLDIIVNCKHCGCKAVIKQELINGKVSHVIRCQNVRCGCALGKRDPEMVKRAWNKHHMDRRPAGVRQHPGPVPEKKI